MHLFNRLHQQSSREYPLRTKSYALARKALLVALCTVMLLFGTGTIRVFADTDCPTDMSALDCEAIIGNWVDWVPDDGSCNSAISDGTDSNGDSSGGVSSDTYTKYPHIKEAFQFFVAHGYSPAQSSGIVGNLMQESGASIDPLDSDGVAHGIAQWQGGRLSPMWTWVAAWAAQNNDPAGKNSFEGQLNYLIYDLNNHYTGVRNTIKGMDSPEQVAIYWNHHYEISADTSNKRPTYARGVFTTAAAQGWANGITVVADPGALSDTGSTANCTAAAGTVVGTTCADIGKTSAAPNPTSNPYVCTNTEVKCTAGSDVGTAQGYNDGKEYDVRLCRVQGVIVNAFIADNINRMIDAAASSNIRMDGGGFRTLQAQIDVRKSNCGTTQYDIYDKPSGDCHPPAAKPKYSNHQMGLAVDWSACSGSKCSTSLISSHGDSGFRWLAANAAKFGFKNLPSEPWHWSVDGG